MQKLGYYREQSERARRLALQLAGDVRDLLLRLAQDFDDIAEDLEKGAVEIRHPERMPQNHH
jgi:hypothetical protein